MDLKGLIRVPKVRMALVLIAIATIGIISQFTWWLVLRYLIILGVTLASEFLLWKIRRIEPFLPSAGVVTATIIFLLSDPISPLWIVLAACLIAVGVKQFLRFWDNHVFNPAATGLLLTSFFGNSISWWGPNSGVIAFWVLILGAGYVSLYSVRQWSIAVGFGVILIVLSFVRTGYSGLTQFADPTLAFFILVMLVEPMTAAKKPLTKPLYGAVVALIYSFLPAIIVNPFLGALLSGNLIFKVVDKLQE